MKRKLMAALALSTLAASCSSLEDRMRGEFLSGYAQSGADRDFCNCVFDQLMLQFDVSYLERMNRTGILGDDFTKATVEAGQQCNRTH